MSRASPLLFSRRRPGVRAVVTGQVGVEKKPFLERVAEIARRRGRDVTVFHVGEMMYAEAPDVVPGRILDLPIGRLNSLRRAVFKEILARAEDLGNLIVNTHATFRWKHGLFPAFDFDQMSQLDADVYVTLVDNVDAIHERLSREHDVKHSLKDILVWREEEILATEVLARAVRGHGCFYVLARGDAGYRAAMVLYRLLFEPERKKVYLSYPMTHVGHLEPVLAQIDRFRYTLAEHFITFDPADVDEKRLLFEAGAAAQRGQDVITVTVNDRQLTFGTAEITSLASDIDGQIYARDFKLIDQSDMIVSYIPELPDGKPGLSSGVERELQHAHEGTKEVYVIWRPRIEPSPFITETATQVVSDLPQALALFQELGYIRSYQMDLPGTEPAAHPPGA